MQITRKIIKLGNSKVISLPKEIANQTLAKNSYVFKITLIGDVEDLSIRQFKCLKCEHVFDSDGEYCPVCGCKDLEEKK